MISVAAGFVIASGVGRHCQGVACPVIADTRCLPVIADLIGNPFL